MNIYDDIEKQIIAALRPIPAIGEREGFSGEKQWSYKLKGRLGELGIRLGYEICTSDFPDIYEREWLYDLVWYNNDDKNEDRLSDVPLVMESEWNSNHRAIKYDFEKLLVANAAHRLLVFQGSTDIIRKRIEFLKKSIEFYKLGHQGDRFLFAAFNLDKWQFNFRLIIK